MVYCFPPVTSKGLAKLRNIVAETLLRMQMFPNLAARETSVAETNFAVRKQKQKMFLPLNQKQFCFPDTNFASETYVSQFSHPGKHNKKHCFRNNASKFSQTLSPCLFTKHVISLFSFFFSFSFIFKSKFSK